MTIKSNLIKKALEVTIKKILPDIIDLKRLLDVEEINIKPFDCRINEANQLQQKNPEYVRNQRIGNRNEQWTTICEPEEIDELKLRTNSSEKCDEFIIDCYEILKTLKERKEFYDKVINYETKYNKELLIEKTK